MRYTFAGSDPGNANYGYGVIEVFPREGFRIAILECGMLTAQITNLTNKEAKPPKSKRRKRIAVPMYAPFPKQYRLFSATWRDIIDTYSTVRVTSERFQSRGLKGLAIELVNMMNATVCAVADKRKVEYEFITPATWKNRVNTYINLEELYTTVELPPHTVDALFIAIYGALQYFDIGWEDVDFDGIIDELFRFSYTK